MTGWETFGVIVAGLVALNSAIDAVRGVTLAPVRIYRWLRRFFRTVDIIASIPGRLDRTEQLLAGHLEQAAPQAVLLHSMARDLGVLVPLAKDVHHEVKHNGGSSIKDAVARIETAVTPPARPTRPAKRGAPA